MLRFAISEQSSLGAIARILTVVVGVEAGMVAVKTAVEDAEDVTVNDGILLEGDGLKVLRLVAVVGCTALVDVGASDVPVALT